MVLVSVIIPCYNVADYIRECIDSVYNQTYMSIEVICIDNNSADETWQVLNEIKQKHKDLIIEQEFAKGACAARNKGLQLAKGDWIQFLDADDLLLPKKIEHQLKLISSATIDFIAAASIKRLINGNEIINDNIDNNIILAPFVNRCGNTCANLWKKSSLVEIGGWDAKLMSSQETDLMIRLVVSGAIFAKDTTPLTIIRERESGQISHRNSSDRIGQFIEMRLNHMDALRNNAKDKFDKIKNTLYDFIVVSIIELAATNKDKALVYYDRINKDWNSDYKFGMSPLKYRVIKLVGLNFFLKLTGH